MFKRFRSRQAKISGILLLVYSVIVVLIVILSTPLPPNMEGQWIAFYCIRSPGHDALITLYAVRADGSEMRTIVAETKHRLTSPAWSPNGEWIAYEYDNEIRIIHPNGIGRRTIVRIQGYNASPAWSPDSKEIAYVHGFQVFYRQRLDNGDYFEIGRQRGVQHGISWSPDGEWIAFGNRESLSLIATDGSGIHEVISRPYASDPAWSPDGEWIAFYFGDDEHETGLYKIRPDGSDLTWITSEHGFDPAWSPDGEWIAFAHVADTSTSISEIYKIRPDGSDFQQITNLGDCLPIAGPTWSPELEGGS